MKTQIWIAVYVLVAIVRRRMGMEASLYQILQILSVTLFEKTPMLRALQASASESGLTDSANQLILFDLRHLDSFDEHHQRVAVTGFAIDAIKYTYTVSGFAAPNPRCNTIRPLRATNIESASEPSSNRDACPNRTADSPPTPVRRPNYA